MHLPNEVDESELEKICWKDQPIYRREGETYKIEFSPDTRKGRNAWSKVMGENG